MAIDLDMLVAGPNMAPQKWQSRCPDLAHDTRKIPVQPSPDLTRILALPRRAQPMPGEEAQLVEFMTSRLARDNLACRCDELQREHGMVDPETGKTPGCIRRLRPIQAWALLEAATKGGLLGAIGVGHGKTILDLLTVLVVPDCRTAALLVPPGLVKQLLRDYEIVGQHFRMPTLILHDASSESRIVPGAPVLHVYPYSLLQRPDRPDYLEDTLRPDTIIADECHKLKRADTATTGRVLRYFKNHPQTRFFAWSGSLTDKSVKDYGHLAALALRLGSPLPIDPVVLDDWARALDPVRPGEEPAPAGALLALCDEGEHVLGGFSRRLLSTHGVIATSTAAVKAKLEILDREAPPIPTVGTLFQPDADRPPISVAQALSMVRYKWKRPDGEDIPDALQRARIAIQVACGFFYRWRFPFVNGKPQSIATILEFLEIRKAWAKEVRNAIRSRREHFDSEQLARNAAERAYGDRPITNKKLPVWKSVWYPAWRDIEDAVIYETEPIWIDDFLARDAATWAHEHRGIVWYSHDAFGRRVAEISKLPCFGGGKENAKQIVRYDGRTSIIASIKSHGTGRDGLQFKYHDQLVSNPGSSNEEWEQLLGRTHRVGQSSDTVRSYFYRHTKELVRNVNQALSRAGYVETSWKSAQKLNLSGLETIEDEIEDDEPPEDE